MHDKLACKKEPWDISHFLDAAAHRALANEHTELDEAGREVLYNLARDRVVSEYATEHEKLYETNWLQLMLELADAPISSTRVHINQTIGSRTSLELGKFVSFHFEKMVNQEGVDLRVATTLSAFSHECNSYRHLRFERERSGLGRTLDLKELMVKWWQGEVYLAEEAKPHQRFEVESERLGFRRHAVPIEPAIAQLRRIILENVGFIHAEVAVQPLGCVGGEQREVVTSSVVGDIDFDSSLYLGYLPQYRGSTNTEVQAEFKKRLPRRDDKIFDYAMAHLPKLMPDRAESHQKMEQVVELLAESHPATRCTTPYFTHESLRDMKHEFNGNSHTAQDDDNGFFYGYCAPCSLPPSRDK